MLTKKEALIPNNLISLAIKTPNIPAGIVCADHNSSMDSAKKAVELNLIKPIFIGNKNAIIEKAKLCNWDIGKYEIIDSSNEKDAAIAGAELARENKIKIMKKEIMIIVLAVKEMINQEVNKDIKNMIYLD